LDQVEPIGTGEIRAANAVWWQHHPGFKSPILRRSKALPRFWGRAFFDLCGAQGCSLGCSWLLARAPESFVHAVAGVSHLHRCYVGVALCGGDSGVAEDLLNHPDVYALLDQQGRCGVPGVVDSGVSYACLLEDGLPLLPVLCALNRATCLGREDQVVISPPVPRFQAFRGLGLLMRLEEDEKGGRTLERQLALSLALPEHQAAAGPLRAPVRVAGCSPWRTDACSRCGLASCSPSCSPGCAGGLCSSSCTPSGATVLHRRVDRRSHAATRTAEFGTMP
jgi:hypothetical protein